tara:strand:+ start:165 stop:518 length:354 start_codon:yes stop_codon:yes gene_type:complete
MSNSIDWFGTGWDQGKRDAVLESVALKYEEISRIAYEHSLTADSSYVNSERTPYRINWESINIDQQIITTVAITHTLCMMLNEEIRDYNIQQSRIDAMEYILKQHGLGDFIGKEFEE